MFNTTVWLRGWFKYSTEVWRGLRPIQEGDQRCSVFPFFLFGSVNLYARRLQQRVGGWFAGPHLSSSRSEVFDDCGVAAMKTVSIKD